MEDGVLPRCTSEDYWNLSSGQRAELIDGVLYDMAPPSVEHQRLVSRIWRELQAHIDQEGGACEALCAPCAVNLDGDDATWVEPDVFVVCDPSKLSARACEGAPDLVIEVVSPGSRRMDYLLKTVRYERAGVREYWIVDPLSCKTTVYRFEEGNPAPRVHPFAEPLTVGIWGNVRITLGELV